MTRSWLVRSYGTTVGALFALSLTRPSSMALINALTSSLLRVSAMGLFNDEVGDVEAAHVAGGDELFQLLRERDLHAGEAGGAAQLFDGALGELADEGVTNAGHRADEAFLVAIVADLDLEAHPREAVGLGVAQANDEVLQLHG